MRFVTMSEYEYMEDCLCHGDGMVQEVDGHGQYVIGGIYQRELVIVNVFEHPESGSAWLLLRDKYGNLFEEEIEWEG